MTTRSATSLSKNIFQLMQSEALKNINNNIDIRVSFHKKKTKKRQIIAFYLLYKNLIRPSSSTILQLHYTTFKKNGVFRGEPLTTLRPI